jgi:hypothetical protein
VAIGGSEVEVEGFLNTEVAEGTEKKARIRDSVAQVQADDAGFVGGVEVAGDGVANHGL